MFHIVKSTEKQCFPENLDAAPNKSHVSVTSKQQGGENLRFQPGLLSRRQNDTAPALKLFFMNMAPAPAPDLSVFMRVSPAPALSFFITWLQLRFLFVFKH